MPTSSNSVLNTIIRIVVVMVCGMGTGYLFYGTAIFVPSYTPAQFTMSSITAALFYGVSRSYSYRSATAAVFVWYVVSTLPSIHNWWIFVLHLVYVAAIAGAVYFYQLLVRRPVLRGIFQRIATFSLLTGTMNAIAILFLATVTTLFSHVKLSTVYQIGFENFQLGTLIGLGIGAGIEIAEYLLTLKAVQNLIEGANAG